MEAQGIVKAVRRGFPKAAIICRGNTLSIVQKYSKNIIALLNVKRKEEFAGLIANARKFIIEISCLESWNQIQFTFEFDDLIFDPGVITIAEGGKTETFDFNRISSEEMREAARTSSFKFSEDVNPRDFNSVAKEIERFFEWSDQQYGDYSITTIDKVSRWTKLRELGISGEFPMDWEISEPKARTEHYSGRFCLSCEFEDNFRWVLQGKQKTTVAGLYMYSDNATIEIDPGDDSSELTILFGVTVFDEY